MPLIDDADSSVGCLEGRSGQLLRQKQDTGPSDANRSRHGETEGVWMCLCVCVCECVCVCVFVCGGYCWYSVSHRMVCDVMMCDAGINCIASYRIVQQLVSSCPCIAL